MNDKELTFLDLLNIMSFCIGLMNLQENVTQGDIQDVMKRLSENTDHHVKEIHKHLETQDDKIDRIIEVLNDEENRNNGM